MKKTVTHLADGRELIYFDESDSAAPVAPDRRDLPAPPPASELRYDALSDEWVAIAAHRQSRTFLPPSDECPLCPSRPPGRLTEIPAADYDVVVFENRFPSFSHRVEGVDQPALGRCEVVCFTSDHDSAFARLTPARVRTVMEAWADRTAELSALPGVEQVFCFENRGVEIGVTLHHPHGQIYAYPFVTPQTQKTLSAAFGNPHVYAEAINGAGDRMVAGNDEWVAFVPYAARWPFEVHVFPRRRVPDIPGLDDGARDAFGGLYLDVLGRFERLFDDGPMPYISAWHQAPVRTGRDLSWLHLRLFSIRRAPGKLKYLAGSESAMGVFVNDIRPEEAAEMLRRA